MVQGLSALLKTYVLWVPLNAAFLSCSLSGCENRFLWPGSQSKYVGSNCAWPACSKSCEPCIRRRVGRCVSKLLGADLRYMCASNATKCVVGRCVCDTDHCAGHRTTLGLVKGDTARLRTCVPQVCYEGGRPPYYQPTFMVQLLASLAPATAFKQVYELDSNWKYFLMTTSGSSVLFGLFGMCIAFITWACLCAGHGNLKGACGFRIAWWCCDRRYTTCDCVDNTGKLDDLEHEFEGNADTGQDLVAVEPVVKWSNGPPSVCPVLRLAMVIATFCAISVTIREFRQNHFNKFIQGLLLEVHEDALNLADKAKIVNQTVGYISETLTNIQNQCALSDPVLVKSTKDATELLEETSDRISHVSSILEMVPNGVLHVMQKAVEAKPFFVWIPVAPQICIGMLALFISVPSLAILCCQKSKCLPKMFDHVLLWLSGLCAFSILLVTVVAVIEMAFCTGASVVCLDIDRVSLHYARKAKRDIVDKAARHYIRGDIPNPIQEVIDETSMMANQVLDLYRQFQISIDIIGWSCMPLYHMDIEYILNTALKLLAESRQISSAQNVWPYYSELLRDALCSQALDSLGYILIFQVLVCLVFFPLTAIRVHHFLMKRRRWLMAKDIENNAVPRSADAVVLKPYFLEPEEVSDDGNTELPDKWSCLSARMASS